MGAMLASATEASAMRPPELTPGVAAALRRDFATSLAKLKGPFSENFCVCRKSGEKRPVMDAKGRITSPCGNDAMFCAAFRAPWAEALAKNRVWIANIFSRDLWLWDSIADRHDLVRGYILEKYFVDTNPGHKLAQLRSFGGLSGSEYETGASASLFERYLSLPDFDDSRHYPLAYELQRRFFVRSDLGQVEKVRSMAVRIQASDPKFKPLRDAVHNQLSASLIPKVAAYRDASSNAGLRQQADALVKELTKLTSLDEGALSGQLRELSDAKLRAEMTALVPGGDSDPVAALVSLGRFMAAARSAGAARRASAADGRRLIDLAITAGAVVQRRGGALMEAKASLTVARHLELLAALTDAAYGAGLLVAREREAAQRTLAAMLADPSPRRADFAANLRQAGRVVEWAQANATLPYAEIWAEWTLLMPSVAGIGDDILRGSPLLLFADVYARLDGYAAGSGTKRHEVFGSEFTKDVRVLNPGLAVGRLRVASKDGTHARNEIVALAETPADLEPAAGILTEGEGNVLSHVQLLARALGIPNVVMGPSAFARIRGKDGVQVFLAATPGGRAVLKPFAEIGAAEKAAWAEYTGGDARSGEGAFGGGGAKLSIDIAKIDLSRKLPISLDEIRRGDSGRLCGPKGAFLGELKHLFPDKVARGIVVPFGAYREHYERARVVVPDSLRNAGVASAGEPLAAFVEKAFAEFFDRKVPSGMDPRALSAWIAPRLEVIRHSLVSTALAPALRTAIREELGRLGLLRGADGRDTVGCFVRSDTNVEDLDTFNGAGLNLTIFNLGTLDAIEEGLRKVWASPFELRSFSWRQTLIDQPLWVLPSVVILESVPSEKSGVLVTCDIETGERGRMVVATSEGVGGAVDGTSAETLLWTPRGTELLTLYKSPWKNALVPGGTRVVPSSGRDEVLSAAEVEELVAAGRAVEQKLEPALDSAGRPRPWDIEFGFAKGKLWLFQSRPFIGNESVRNVPALAVLDGPGSGAAAKDKLSLQEELR
jgi:phosphohistidine swiveling domain-containing protein